MRIICYRCKCEKEAVHDFSASRREGSPSKIVCRKCWADYMKHKRNGDPALKWGRFNFTRKPYARSDAID